MTTETPRIGKWIHPSTGRPRYYINNWAALCGISVSYYGTGNISGVSIEDYDDRVSNTKGAATITGRVWIDFRGEMHLDDHDPRSLLTDDEKRERIIEALTGGDPDADLVEAAEAHII